MSECMRGYVPVCAYMCIGVMELNTLLQSILPRSVTPYIGAKRTHFHTLCCCIRHYSHVDTPASPRRGRACSGDNAGPCQWCIQPVHSCRLSRMLQIATFNLSTIPRCYQVYTCGRTTQACVHINTSSVYIFCIYIILNSSVSIANMR